MHRSGTSLTAMWMHGCGLFLGDRLMSGDFDNPLGHFEDLDILHIHERDLQEKKLMTNGLRIKPYREFEFEASTRPLVEAFLKSREKHDQWGWKEPRSTLYLEAWKKIIPGLKVLAIYRGFDEVVDSLVRRTKYSVFKSGKFKGISNILHRMGYPAYIQWEKSNYIDAWIKYNSSILAFKDAYPDDIHIVNLETLIRDSRAVFEKISDKWNLDLEFKRMEDFYQPGFLKSNIKKNSSDRSENNPVKLIREKFEMFNNQ